MNTLIEKYSLSERRELILASRGAIPADMVLTNVNIVVPTTEEVLENYSVVIKGKRIARIGRIKDISRYISSRTRVVDCEGKYALPGFIDLHIHVESSLLNPVGFAKIALKHGTTTVVADPHEIANVLGAEGVEIFISITRDLPLKFLVEVPSCVPATDPYLGLETAPHVIDSSTVSKLVERENVCGLGEVMDFISVVHASEEVLRKVEAAKNKGLIIDGHAPQLKGSHLDAYISAGIISDHETTALDEAIEKLRRGMWIYIREGSAWRDLEALVSIVRENACDLCVFVSDDLNVYDLFTKGHMDRIINRAIELGVDPVKAVKYATLYPAIRLHLEDHIGLIAPGRIADIVLTSRIERIQPETVIANGELIYYKNTLQKEFKKPEYPPRVLQTVKLGKLPEVISYTPRLKEFVEHGYARVNVIEVKPGSTLTKKVVEELEVENGVLKTNYEKDIMYVVVADRHTGSGRFSTGFIKGLGFKAGAIAQTIAHDTHNLVVAGWNPRDMDTAVREVERIQGGIVIVDNGKIVAELELRLAGLMSIEEPEVVYEKYTKMLEYMRSHYNVHFESFFMTLSLVSLPVIPEVRITDRGLVDVQSGRLIPLVEEVYKK
ncbi:MAG: adenine deaminase [Desulfurococcaceae archaeon]